MKRSSRSPSGTTLQIRKSSACHRKSYSDISEELEQKLN